MATRRFIALVGFVCLLHALAAKGVPLKPHIVFFLADGAFRGPLIRMQACSVFFWGGWARGSRLEQGPEGGSALAMGMAPCVAQWCR